MYYQVSQEFFEKLPNACFGAVAVRGLDNTHDIPQLEQMLAENVAACEAYFAGKKPKETEDILPYRNAFTAGDGGYPPLPQRLYGAGHQPQQVPVLH